MEILVRKLFMVLHTAEVVEVLTCHSFMGDQTLTPKHVKAFKQRTKTNISLSKFIFYEVFNVKMLIIQQVCIFRQIISSLIQQ